MQMKIMIDGPEVNDFVSCMPREGGGGEPFLRPCSQSKLGFWQVQQTYVTLGHFRFCRTSMLGVLLLGSTNMFTLTTLTGPA